MFNLHWKKSDRLIMKSLSSFLNLAIFIAVVCTGYFIFYPQTSNLAKNPQMNTQPLNSRTTSSIDPQDLANKYMQQVQYELNLQKMKLSSTGLDSLNKHKKINSETDPRKISADQQIWKESDQGSKAKTADEIFNENYEREQHLKQQQVIEKAEYIRQYKENAKKEGYDIVLSDDLEVISVTPIRKPSNDFDQNKIESDESEY